MTYSSKYESKIMCSFCIVLICSTIPLFFIYHFLIKNFKITIANSTMLYIFVIIMIPFTRLESNSYYKMVLYLYVLALEHLQLINFIASAEQLSSHNNKVLQKPDAWCIRNSRGKRSHCYSYKCNGLSPW